MQVETRTRAAIALVLACTSIVAAQEPAIFRTSTDVVLVPISVTDRNGRFVRGLTSDHFQISDGGTRRAVKQFSAERVPISLAILLDISGSMAQNPKSVSQMMRDGPTHAGRSHCCSLGSALRTKCCSRCSTSR